MNERVETLIHDLPDPEAARRFLGHLAQASPAQSAKLLKNEALLSDALTLVSFSPLLTTTLLQNPEYLTWLDRKRKESGVRGKEELLESLAQFSSTNSQLEPQVLFARFRRRELLRIYLHDIRRLATIAEITEEISNLADAILEFALRLARREIDDRFGQPQESDEKGRPVVARFCIAALGKLGSRELNYSSDIDLLFIYSGEGMTSGNGKRGSVTNREYFIKLAEFTTKLVGQPSGEGAAYRVDLRLRPHGTLGPLAVSVNDLVRYHETEARPWERQVMIRSRGCAGDVDLFREFLSRVEHLVFSTETTPELALNNVKRSKEKIDLERSDRRGFDVKLGSGGIREIEFIAQALQLAHGGLDEWLRAPHTLISLDRLAGRGHLSESELTSLAAGYEFLRRTEHVLQMENGVQTHTVPDEPDRRSLLARRMTFAGGGKFESLLAKHTKNVSGIFSRVFNADAECTVPGATEAAPARHVADDRVIERLRNDSPHFASLIAGNPRLIQTLSDPDVPIGGNYEKELSSTLHTDGTFRDHLASLRQKWSRLLLEIVVHDVFQTIDQTEAKRLQTLLAEASINAALEIVRIELGSKYRTQLRPLAIAVLALGKLGGRGMDYDSDLDLILVYDDNAAVPEGASHVEFFSRAAEMFVTVLSSMTRDGSMYRVDLRLRPYGSKGLSAMASGSFLEYMRDTAAIWEFLAFVKLRSVGGDAALGTYVENDTRQIIHERASRITPDELRVETRRVRLALEEQRARPKRGNEIDIKYGEGGMLDVYFAMRYLQLLWHVPDEADDRSTVSTIDRLMADTNSAHLVTSLTALRDGYIFLSSLDHCIRLVTGRTTRVPTGNETAMRTIAERMSITSPAELLEQLTIHRLTIREAFDTILSNNN